MIQKIADDIWCFKVGEHSSGFEFFGSKVIDEIRWIETTINNDKPKFTKKIKQFPPGQWEFICTSNNATEVDARKIVSGYRFIEGRLINGDPNCFTNYQNPYSSGPDAYCQAALASLRSLLKSKGLEGNFALIRKL